MPRDFQYGDRHVPCHFYPTVKAVIVCVLFCSDSNGKSKHKLPKRVHVAKTEDLLGDDTSKIDEAEYRLQSMISPETHDADRFFKKTPSKQIGNFRVDTLSPAQISFIQSSNQWHKYFRPSSPLEFSHNNNIYPEDPVLFPGAKKVKSREHEGGADFLEGLGDGEIGRRQDQSNTWNSDSLASYGDTTAGFQHPKDYLDSPFTDKSWWNQKSDEASHTDSYSSLDENSIAEPLPKNYQDLPAAQNDVPSSMEHFPGRTSEMLETAGVGHIGTHQPPAEDQRATLLGKLEDLKDRFRLAQNDDDDNKVFYGGHQKISFGQSGIVNLPMESSLGMSKGLGTALAEELLQRNKEKEKNNEEIQGNGQTRSGTNYFDGLRFSSSPLFEENASQQTNHYASDFNNEGSHVVLIRSQQVKDTPKKTSVAKHVTKSRGNKKFPQSRNSRKKQNGDIRSAPPWKASHMQLNPKKRFGCLSCNGLWSHQHSHKIFSLNGRRRKLRGH